MAVVKSTTLVGSIVFCGIYGSGVDGSGVDSAGGDTDNLVAVEYSALCSDAVSRGSRTLQQIDSDGESFQYYSNITCKFIERRLPVNS